MNNWHIKKFKTFLMSEADLLERFLSMYEKYHWHNKPDLDEYLKECHCYTAVMTAFNFTKMAGVEFGIKYWIGVSDKWYKYIRAVDKSSEEKTKKKKVEDDFFDNFDELSPMVPDVSPNADPTFDSLTDVSL